MMRYFFTRRLASKVGFLVAVLVATLQLVSSIPASAQSDQPKVLIAEMKMMILPGTHEYFLSVLDRAVREDADLVIVRLDTPGGMLNVTQDMIQEIFQSPVPVAIYVGPSGGTATSAGVFITMAAHIAAMTPGTSMGAAHPVAGDGKDIEGDMRKKAEEMASALVKSISARRGRNIEWAEKAVKESNSIVEDEALRKGVVDIVAKDIDDLLRQVSGRKLEVLGKEKILPDLIGAQRLYEEISARNQIVNVLANPSVAALLWLGASTGIAAELYNPGMIFPGVVGVICLVLALAVSSIIPLSTGGIALIMLGGLLVGAELYVTSGILGAGGVVALLLGLTYLVDTSLAPGFGVPIATFFPLALFLSGCFLFVMYKVKQAMTQPEMTGSMMLTGRTATVISWHAGEGKVKVAGEIWNARSESGGSFEEGESVRVAGESGGLEVVVRSEDKKGT